MKLWSTSTSPLMMFGAWLTTIIPSTIHFLAESRMNSWNAVAFLFSVFYFRWVTGQQQSSDSIVACGGFVRWKPADGVNGAEVKNTHVDYSRLRVNIFSENGGTLVDVTDILPNGAFSLPVYGEDIYRLLLTSPDGWHVSPTDGYLLDLRKSSSACSADFNFYLLGFTIYGQIITHGLTTGPSDLYVHVLRTDTKVSILSNITTEGGRFSVAPIPPGNYTLIVSDKQKTGADFEPDHSIRARGSVRVNSDNVRLSDPLVLLGHYLHGSVIGFNGKPCSACLVFLLSQSVDMTAIGCDTRFDLSIVGKLLSQLQLKQDTYGACQTSVDAYGHFSFERLPGGQYILLPYYQQDRKHYANYNFHPPYLAVNMQHADIDLTRDSHSTFVASGLELPSGRVVWPDGKPIAGAAISISGLADQILTNADGRYQPGSIRPGQVTISVTSGGAQFDPIVFDPLTAAAAPTPVTAWPVLTPTRLSVCGRFTSAQKPGGFSSLAGQHVKASVIFSAQDKRSPVDRQIVQADLDKDGELRFCSHLLPGEYIVTSDVTVVSTNDQDPNTTHLPFTPSSLTMSLVSGPMSLVFTQFSANLTGRLICLLASCGHHLSTPDSLALKLTPVVEAGGDGGKQMLVHSSVVNISLTRASPEDHSAFEFTALGVPPGEYTLELVLRASQSSEALSPAGWCWTNPKSGSSTSTARHLRIGDKNVSWRQEPALVFQQSGYLVHVNTATVWSDQVPVESLQPQTIGWLRLSLDSRANEKSNDGQKHPRLQQDSFWRIIQGNNQICVPSSKYEPLAYHISVSSSCLDLQLLHPSSARLDPEKDFSPLESKVPQLLIAVTGLPVNVQFAYPSSANLSASSKVRSREPVTVDLVTTTNIAVTSPREGETQTLPQHKTVTRSKVAWSQATEKTVPSASLIHWVKLELPARPLEDQTVTAHSYLLVRSEKEVEEGAKPTPSQWHLVYFLPTGMKQSVSLTMRINNEAGTWDQSPLLFPVEKADGECGGDARKPLLSHRPWLPVLQFVLQPGVILRGQIVPPVDQVRVRLWRKPEGSQNNNDVESTAQGGPTDGTSSAPQPRLLPIFSEEEVGEGASDGGSISSSQPDEDLIDADNDSLSARTSSSARSSIATSYTDRAGVFHFGPLALPPGWTEVTDPATLFEVNLEKAGFQFTSRPASPINNWLFESMKLSLVQVVVLTSEERKPLAGVLVSIIGESYRENMLTSQDGLVQFVGLAQGQYYIRPMMKEFAFTFTNVSPPTTSGTASSGAGRQKLAIPVEVVAGGPDITVEITAKRTAFSLLGQVLSLARHPLADVTVEAKWLAELPPQTPLLELEDTDKVTCQLTSGGHPHSSVPREQAVTDGSGIFRIRGLLPGCVYALQVQRNTSGRSTAVDNHTAVEDAQREAISIDRVIPPVIQIVMPPRDTDLTSSSGDNRLVFYAFHQLHLTTLTASVDVPDEFRDSLQLTLFPVDRPDGPVARHNFKTDSLLFSLSGATVTSMAGHEYVMRLESSLSPLTYEGVSSQDRLIRLKPNLSEHVRFTFRPVLRPAPSAHSTTDEL